MITYTRQRFTAATLTNGKYELTSERQTVTDQILFIPGVSSPLAELKNLLFKQGQAGGIWVPSLSPTMISSESFGTGVQTFLDLSGNGKNATQASSGSRPAWGRVPKTGRRNLLVNTNFNGTVAGSPGTAPTNWIDVVSTGQIVAYDSTTGKIRLSTSGTRRGFGQVANMLANSTQTAKVNVNVISGTVAVGRVLTVSSALPAGASAQWKVNGVNVANSGVALPAGESELSLVLTTTTNAWTLNIEYGNGVGGTATGEIELWEPQLDSGSTVTGYQRVGLTAFDITETGQRDCYYLQPDGVDDGMATASIDFSGTDKVTVWAAVRKLSDAAAGDLCMLGTNVNADGHFRFLAPTTTGGNNYRMRARGTVQQDATSPSSYTSPTTNILTGIAEISTPLVKLRVDQAEFTQTDSQGTGNFLDAELNIFSRGSTFFNGQCFGLIVAGGSYPLSTIQRVERILSRYTPGVSL